MDDGGGGGGGGGSGGVGVVLAVDELSGDVGGRVERMGAWTSGQFCGGGFV